LSSNAAIILTGEWSKKPRRSPGGGGRAARPEATHGSCFGLREDGEASALWRAANPKFPCEYSDAARRCAKIWVKAGCDTQGAG